MNNNLLQEHPEELNVRGNIIPYNRAIGCFILFELNSEHTFAYSYNGMKKVSFGDGTHSDTYPPHEEFLDGETHKGLFNAIQHHYSLPPTKSPVISGRIWKVKGVYYISCWQNASDIKGYKHALIKCIFHMTKEHDIDKFQIEISEGNFIPLQSFISNTSKIANRTDLEALHLLHTLPPEEKNKELRRMGSYMKIDDMPNWMKKRMQGLDEMDYPMATGKDLTSYEGNAGWKGKIVWMTPDRFLSMCYPLTNPESESLKNLEHRMLNKLPIDFLVLVVDVGNKKVTGHEGRHRATVAKKLGIEKIPVLIYTGSGFKRVPTWDDKDHEYIDGIANVGHDIKPEYIKEFYRLFTEASMIPTADEREAAIRQWLDNKISNAPGNSHMEKTTWLWNNDPQYSKVTAVYLKLPKSSAHRRVESHEKYYIRFGDLPKAGKSMNYFRMVHEKGISAYPAKWNTTHDKWEILDNQLSDGGLSGLYELTHDSIHGVGNRKRPIYLITGYEIDELGGDDEPLLDVNRIKILKKLQPHDFFSYELGVDWYL